MAHALNVGRNVTVKGNLLVSGDLIVDGVADIGNREGSSSGETSTGGTALRAEVEALREELAAESEARRTADSSLSGGLGLARTDAVSAQNTANTAKVRSEDALLAAEEAANAADQAKAHADMAAAAVRRDLGWWVFPVTGGKSAVTTDGASSVVFGKDGFRIRIDGSTYSVRPPMDMDLTYKFDFGETGYLAVSISRLLRFLNDKSVSTAQVVEKITDPAALSAGSHIPVAVSFSGTIVKLVGAFADIYG